MGLDRLSAWDQSVGVLPADPQWIAHEVDARSFANALFDALEAAGVPMETVEQVFQSAEGRETEYSGGGELEPPS